MKINFKKAALWLLGIALICLGISFFLFHQAGVGFDTLESTSVKTEGVIADSSGEGTMLDLKNVYGNLNCIKTI